MKIRAVDASTKKPLANLKVQLQLKGKESGFLSVTTDANGEIQLDERYKDHQVAALLNGIQGAWVPAAENATLIIDTKKITTSTSSSTGSATPKEKNKETWK